MIFGDDIITALVAIQMSGGGTSAVVKPLTVTENGTYTASDYGCDGFDPVNVQVPDRYDEGYADGYNEGHEVGYTEGYDVGHSDGYNEGYDFAYNFYNNIVDENKEYTIVFYFDYSYTGEANTPWFMCEIYNTADMSQTARFNYWPAPYRYRANPRIINAWVEPESGRPVLEVETTDASGGNKARYIYHFDRSQIYYSNYFPSNTNIICKLPTE